ncbi:6544_t:CDS:2 [Entrophospora sp. SA101]|nr:6544_t:CDS:2 [Entrophospora sp. SA101]
MLLFLKPDLVTTSREIKDFNTYHKNIRVKIEGLNEDIARVFLVDANDDQIVITENIVFINATTKKEILAVDVKGKKSYLITWIHSYELSVDGEKIFMLSQRKEQRGSFGLGDYLV